MEALAELWEGLLGKYNDLVVEEFEQVPEGPTMPRLELAKLTAAGSEESVEQLAYLVDAAKAEALKDMDDDGAAITLMEKWS